MLGGDALSEKDKNRWLPELVEDMVLYCSENNLLRSREALREAHQVIVAETIYEQYMEKLGRSDSEV